MMIEDGRREIELKAMCWFPRVHVGRVSGPLDEVLATRAGAAGVDEGFHVVVLLAVDDVRGWRVPDGGGGWTKSWFEVGDVDDAVVTKVGGKGEFVDDVGPCFNDEVRSVKLGAQLASGARGGGWVKEGGLNPGVGVDWEGDVVAMAIGCDGLGCLGVLKSKAGPLMEGFAVSDVVGGVGGAR